MSSSESPNNPQEPENEVEETSAADGQTTEETAPLTLEEQLDAAYVERDKCRDLALRANAELENFRKRTKKEVSDMLKYAEFAFVRDLLPGLDNLRRALSAAEQSSDANELLQGVNMVLDQFEGILASHHVLPIVSQGELFDPNLHEALTQVPSADHPPMTILEEVERGYQMYDRVVRPGKVIVSKEVDSE